MGWYWETVDEGFETKEEAQKWIDNTNAMVNENEQELKNELWDGLEEY